MDEIKALIAKLEVLFDKEQYNAMIDLLPDEVLEKYKNADLYAWRAWAYIRLKQADNAFADAEKAIAIDPYSFFGWRLRGVAWDDKGEYDKAIADYDKAIELKKDYAFAYYNRGISWDNKGEYDKAIADYDKAIELKKDYAFAYNNRGTAWFNKGEYDKAIADYDKAIELKKDNAVAYNNRGLAWNNKGEYDKAIADYDKAIELNKDDAVAYNNRGTAWFNKGEYDKAIADYDKAIELKKDYAHAYNNRGVAWDNKGEYDKAIADYDKAIELKKDYALAYNNRGISWDNKGDYDKAIADYDKAIELKKDYALAYRNRGDVLYEKGDYEKAIVDYEMAKSLDRNKLGFLETKIKWAQEKIEERKQLAASGAGEVEKETKQAIDNEVEKIIAEIRNTASSDVKTVVHYTKLFVADIYVKNLHAKMHYSNAIYMNDPMEGKVFFEYLNDTAIEKAYRNGESRTETSVYLGSFLPAEDNDGHTSHEDELVMWRTYGKDENGKEAAGCSVVLDSDFFKLKIQDGNQASAKDVSDELLNVVYIKKLKTKSVVTNDNKAAIEAALKKLKLALGKYIKLMAKYKSTDDFYKDIENSVFKNISTISYLFKSADYEYEHEVRIITYMPRNSDSIKCMDIQEAGRPPKRFFIESYNDILPYIKKIYLGPKVEHHQQWSLYFDYEIRQRAKDIEKMSPPPYKLSASEIEIMKSTNQFQ